MEETEEPQTIANGGQAEGEKKVKGKAEELEEKGD